MTERSGDASRFPIDGTLLVIGSGKSLHTWVYASSIAPFVEHLLLITDGQPPAWFSAPSNLRAHLYVDFSFSARGTTARIQEFVHAHRPDLIHIHQANSVAWHAYRARACRELPSVLTAWGSDVLVLPERNLVMRRMVRRNLMNASLLTSESRWTGSQIRALAGHGVRHRVLNWGVAPRDGNINPVAKENIVLSPRLHQKLYRIDAILRSWKELLDAGAGAGWRLVVAAAGEETDRLKGLASQLRLTETVEFTGWLPPDEISRLFSRSRVLVSVPTSDAVSLSLLEAMSWGCIPVTSYLPATTEWILDGTNGLFVDDMSGLASVLGQAMEVALDQERSGKWASLNSQIVKTRASRTENIAKFAELYRELLDADPTPRPVGQARQHDR